MTIFVTCSCGQQLEIENDLAGEQVRCPGCAAIVEAGAKPSLEFPQVETITHNAKQKPANQATAPQIDGYEILEELGRGGMGVVYKARQPSLGRIVALKTILTGGFAGDEERLRFRREAEAVARLHHPNIVQIHEIGEQNGQPYFSLEFMENGSLSREVRGQPQPPIKAAELVEALARAIQHAHEQGIIHRDLKPANILLSACVTESAFGLAKVSDFGLAKHLQAQDGPTQTGAILGTPSYMAPEQVDAKGKSVGPAADIYALGAVLYYLITGRAPFAAETPLDTMTQVLNNEPTPPSRLQPKVPRDLETICLKCLQKEQQRRYPDAQNLAEDLRRFRDGLPIAARRVGRGERLWRWCKRNPALAASSSVALAGMIAALVGLVVFMQNRLELNKSKHAVSRAEESEKAQAEAKRRAEKHAQQESERRVEEEKLAAAELLFEKAYAKCRQGELGRMHWLARSLETAVANGAADLEEAIRRQITAWDAASHKLRFVFLHDGAVKAVAFSPDGGTVLTGSADQTARLWDVASGRELCAPLRHDAAVSLVSFSSDGDMVLTGSGDKLARFWNRTGRLKRTVPVSKTVAMAFSPDGKLALANSGGVPQVWRLETGENVKLVNAKSVLRAAFSPDSKLVVIGGSSSPARLWDTNSGKPLGEPFTKENAYGLSFSADGKTVITAVAADNTVKMFETASGKQTGPVLPHHGFVQDADFSADGKLIFTTLGDTVRIWDAVTGRLVGTPLSHSGFVSRAAFSPDGGALIVGCYDGSAYLWELARDNLTSRALQRSKSPVLACSPDGKTVLLARGNRAEFCDLRTGAPLGQAVEHKGPIREMAFSPDGQRAVTACADQKGAIVQLWDVGTSKAVFQPLRLDHSVTALSFHPAGDRIAIAANDKNIRIWDPVRGKVLQTWPFPSYISDVAFAQGGDILLIASQLHVLRWRIDTAQLLEPPLPHNSSVHAVAVSPDGKAALTACFDKAARLWDLSTGTLLIPPLQHEDTVVAVAFAPDGKTIATGSNDKTVRFWDPASGKAIGPPLLHNARIRSVAFTMQGQALATASDKETRIWQAPEPRTGSAEQISLRLQVDSGLTLGSNAALRTLDAGSWRQCWENAAHGPGQTDRLSAVLWPLYSETFDNPNSDWPNSKKDSRDVGVADGRFFIHLPKSAGWWGWGGYGGRFSNFACEVEARVVGPHSNGWGLVIRNEETHKHGIQVRLDSDARLTVEPARGEPEPERGPRIGPISHPAIKKGDAFNTLRVAVQGRQVHILVNGVAVYPPLQIDRDITPAAFFLAAIGGPNESQVEFERITVYPADPPIALLHKNPAELLANPLWHRHEAAWHWTKKNWAEASRHYNRAQALAAAKALSWPADLLREGKIMAPDLASSKPLLAADLRDPRTNFKTYQEADGSASYDGGFYAMSTSSWCYWNCPGLHSNVACEVVGRVASASSDSWGLSLTNQQNNNHGVRIAISGAGQLRIGPTFFEPEKFHGPFIGPIAHPAIKRGREFNALLLIARGRTLEVYVNGVAVCDPIPIDRDITPGVLCLGCEAGQANAKVEFERLTVWSAAGLPTPQQRGATLVTQGP